MDVIEPGVLSDPHTFLARTGTRWLWLGSVRPYGFGRIQIFVGKWRTGGKKDHLFVHVVACVIAGRLAPMAGSRASPATRSRFTIRPRPKPAN